MNFRNLLPISVATSALSIQGCITVGPDYESPGITAPDAWTASASRDLRKGSSNLQTWWKGFKDPVLNILIDRTREANLSLKIAAQRVSEARSLRRVAQSQLFPAVGANGEYLRNRASESLLAPVPKNPSNFYVSGFDAGWEIDVFGGIRRSVEAADANIEASVEDYRDLLIILYAETALNYVEYRTLQSRIAVTNANVASQEETVKLAQSRLDAELVPRIDVTQATTNLEISRSLLPLLRTQLAFAKNRLATLTGGYPKSVEKLLARSRPIPNPRKGYSAGLPADLLRARPDVRGAERRLAAQTARIGVAAADLYPRFSLLGTLSLQAADASNFWDSASRAYSFGPNFRWQIFSAGRIRANIDIQEALTEQALVNYEQTVLLAVEEVESSMAAVANGWDSIAILARAVASANETVGMVKENYKAGLVDFQRVLDAERDQFATEDSQAVAHGQIALSYIALYKALGGGSEVEIIPIAEPRTQAKTLFGKKGKSSDDEPVEPGLDTPSKS